jgi:hypothetical protein
MKIDIDKLTEAELVDLNNRIVERLRLLQQMRAHAQMLEFRIGDRVSFQPPPAVLRPWFDCRQTRLDNLPAAQAESPHLLTVRPP